MHKNSINLSHRHLVKEKTKQLFYYPIHTHQALSPRHKVKHQVSASTNEVSKKMKAKQNDYETSIDLDNECDTSLGKNVRSQSVGSGKKIVLRGDRIKIGNRRLSHKAKSVEVISKNKLSPSNLRHDFSIKKYKRSPVTASCEKLSPIENIEKQSQKAPKTSVLLPKSDSYLSSTLKNNLKKTSTTKLKQNMRLKVVDPFEKRFRLDQQFHDQSAVIHNAENNESIFISTVNREEFMDLLKDIV